MFAAQDAPFVVDGRRSFVYRRIAPCRRRGLAICRFMHSSPTVRPLCLLTADGRSFVNRRVVFRCVEPSVLCAFNNARCRTQSGHQRSASSVFMRAAQLRSARIAASPTTCALLRRAVGRWSATDRSPVVSCGQTQFHAPIKRAMRPSSQRSAAVQRARGLCGCGSHGWEMSATGDRSARTTPNYCATEARRRITAPPNPARSCAPSAARRAKRGTAAAPAPHGNGIHALRALQRPPHPPASQRKSISPEQPAVHVPPPAHHPRRPSHFRRHNVGGCAGAWW